MAVSSIRTLRQRTVPLRPDPDQIRLQQIEDSWQQFPGRAPGGTGLTGLLPNDSRGYSDMLNEQTEYANLLRRREGQGPLRVVQGRGFGPEPSYTAGDALEDVARSMPYYQPPPVQGAAPPSPAAPPAPKAPPLPPPTGARLGSLATQPGAVSRYGNAFTGAPVTAAAFLPSDVTDDLPSPMSALGRLKARTIT